MKALLKLLVEAIVKEQMDDRMVYHGTTIRSWKSKRPGLSSLYFTFDPNEAEKFGIDSCETYEDIAIVMATKLSVLRSMPGIELLPDEACLVSHGLDQETSTWKDSASTCGMFSVYGNIEKLVKPLLHRIKMPITEQMDEAAFGSFSLSKFKSLSKLYPDDEEELVRKMFYYVDNSGLKFLGQGSSRMGYAISPGKVLKILRPDDLGGDSRFGRQQMQDEINAYLTWADKLPGCFAEIFDYDPDHNWLISEPVRTFSQTPYEDGRLRADTGLDSENLRMIALGGRTNFPTVADYMKNVIDQAAEQDAAGGFAPGTVASIAGSSPRVALAKKYLNDKLPAHGKELLDKIFMMAKVRFIDINRADHWGISASGKVVCVDYGLAPQQPR